MNVTSKSVLLIGPFPPPLTGLSAYQPYLRALLARRGGRVTVLALPTRDPSDGLSGAIRKVLASAGAFCRIITGPGSCSVVLTLDSGSGLLLNIVLVLACRLRRFSVCLSHHSFRYVNRFSLLMRILQFVGGDSVTNLFLCGAMRDGFLKRYAVSGNTLIINNAARVASELGEPVIRATPVDGVLVLGFLSNITFEKGLKNFCGLVIGLQQRGLRIRGLVAGPAASSEVAAYLSKMTLESGGDIVGLGSVRGAEKTAFLSGIDFLVLPTEYDNEAQPNVILEALAFGVRCLSTARGCIACDLAGSGSLVIEDASEFIDLAISYLTDEIGARGRVEGHLIKSRLKAHAKFVNLLNAARTAEEDLLDHVWK